MKQTDTPGKSFRLELNRNCGRYDGKSVEFIYDLDGNLLLLTGQFGVHITPEFGCLDIHYTGRLHPFDPPCSEYVFHLSQAHLKSTVAATKPGSKADFLMERPLLACECVKSDFADRIASAPLPA